MLDFTIQQELEKSLTRHLQLSVKLQIIHAERIHGGDINETFRMDTSQGRFFLKLNDAVKHPEMFTRELCGLEELRQAEVITVPRPVCSGVAGNRAFLVSEFVEKGAAAPDFWENFAASMARMHQQTRPWFGLNTSNYIGSIKQYNTPYANWAVFYAMNRLMPLAKMAYDNHRLDASLMQKLEKVCRKLPELFPEEPPALLHGDLWSGNFLVAQNGRACIFDPAVYYGHREMDMAMTRLFGGFDTRFYYTYQAIHPLEQGWQERLPLCQLYPLLVHLNLFGGSYYSDVKDALEQFN